MTAPDLTGLEERATRAAGAAAPGTRIDHLEPLPGGHSGLTLRCRWTAPDGAERPVVLKAAPPGRAPAGRHDVLRQARLLRRLEGTAVPVPRILLEVDGDVPFYVMSWAEGDAVEPVLDEHTLHDAEVTRRAWAATCVLAELHRLDPADGGADGSEPALSVADELERWAATMQAVPEELRPRAGDLRARLGDALPSPTAPRIVHGDYRLGNVICDGVRPTAVIDWEIWSVSDPRIDLAWFLVFTDASRLPGVGRAVPGMPSADELRACYEQLVGETLEDWAWFDAFGRYKMAAIMGHNLRRHREGRHHDPFQETLVPTILSLVDQGLELVA